MNLAAGPSLEPSWASQLGGASVQTSLANNSLLGHYAGTVGSQGLYNIPTSSALLNPLGPSLDALAYQQSAGFLQNKVNGHLPQLSNGLGLQSGLQSGLQAGVQSGYHAGLQHRHLQEQLAAIQLQKSANASQYMNSALSMSMAQSIPQSSMLQVSQPMLPSQLMLNNGMSAQTANQYLNASLAGQHALASQQHLVGQTHPLTGQPLGLTAQAHALAGQTHPLTGQPVQNPNAAAAYYLLQSSSAAANNQSQSQQLYNLLANQTQLHDAQVAAAAAASQAQQRAKELTHAANMNLAARLNNPAAMQQYLQAQNGAAQLNYQQQINAANASASFLLNQAAKPAGHMGFQGVGGQLGNQLGGGNVGQNSAALRQLLNGGHAGMQAALNQSNQVNNLNIAALQAGLFNRNPAQLGNAAAPGTTPSSIAASIAQYQAAAVAAAAAAAAVTSAHTAVAQSSPLAAYQSIGRPNTVGSALGNHSHFSNAVALNGMGLGGAGLNGAANRNNNSNYLATALLHGLVPPSAALPSVSGGLSLSVPMVSEPSSARSNSFDTAVAAPIHLSGASNLAVGSKPLGPVGPPDASAAKQPSTSWMSLGSSNIPVPGGALILGGSRAVVMPPLETASSVTSNQSASSVAFETKTLTASSDLERISQLKDFGVRLAQSHMTVEQAIQQGLLGGLGASEVQVLLSACEAAAQQMSNSPAATNTKPQDEVKPPAAGVEPAAPPVSTAVTSPSVAEKPQEPIEIVAAAAAGNKTVNEQVTDDALDGKFDAFSYQFFGEDVELVSLQELEGICVQEGSNDVAAEPNRSDGLVVDVVDEVNETVQESGIKTEPVEGVVADRLANLDLGLGFF